MRNLNRIDEFCNELARLWKTNCIDWRFGQLISNVLGSYQDETKRDIFFPEDDELLDFFKKYFGELKPCPFCGGEAKIIVCDREGNLHDEGYERNSWSGLGYLIFHKSEDCPVGHSYPSDVRCMYDTEAEAIEAWNMRSKDN